MTSTRASLRDRKRRQGPAARLACLAGALLSGGLAANGQSTPGAPAPSPPAVSEISLERLCFGCENAFRLVLRRDGSASRTRLGNARLGVPESHFKGVVPEAEFVRLERLLHEEGFFQMPDGFRDPSLQDGETHSVTAVRGDQVKRVVNANRAGPPALERVQAAIEQIASRISWLSPSP